MASVAIADLPAQLRRGASPYPQPVALLARPAAGCDQPGRHPQQGHRLASPSVAAACWSMPNLSRLGASTST